MTLAQSGLNGQIPLTISKMRSLSLTWDVRVSLYTKEMQSWKQGKQVPFHQFVHASPQTLPLCLVCDRKRSMLQRWAVGGIIISHIVSSEFRFEWGGAVSPQLTSLQLSSCCKPGWGGAERWQRGWCSANALLEPTHCSCHGVCTTLASPCLLAIPECRSNSARERSGE